MFTMYIYMYYIAHFLILPQYLGSEVIHMQLHVSETLVPPRRAWWWWAAPHIKVPSQKLTGGLPKRKLIFQPQWSRYHVSFRECITTKLPSQSTWVPTLEGSSTWIWNSGSYTSHSWTEKIVETKEREEWAFPCILMITKCWVIIW